MKIIEQSRAPNPRRVRIYLAEKGVEVPFEQIDIMKREHRSTRFSALNPAQQVPVLVLDDGTAISESVAICRYFEAIRPEPPLFGVSPVQQAIVEMWNRRIEHGLLHRVSQCFRHGRPAMAELESPQVPAWAEVNREKAAEELTRLDAHLAASPFVAGPDFTIADITALVAVDFMKPARIVRPAGLGHLERWYEWVASRPSAKAM